MANGDVDWRDFRERSGPEQRALLAGLWREGMRSALAPPPAAEGAVEAAAAVVYTAAGLATPPVRWFVSPSSAARAVASLARGGPLTGVVDAPPGAGSTAYAIEPLRRALADAWRDVWTRVDAAGERDTAERLAARLHRLGSSEQLDPSPSEALRGASGLTGEVVRELGDDAEHVRSPLFAHSSTETGGHLLAVLLQRVLGTGSPVLAAAGTLATHAGPAWPFVDVLVCTARPA